MTLFILAMAVTVVLLLIGVPVAFAFGVGALLFSYITGSNISFLLPHGYNTVASFSLLALPLFIFSGFVMAESGISERILNFINAFVGRIKGGLGAVTVISCTLFGAISGSSTAAIAAIGKIMIPRMVKEGYPEGHATGLVACSSVLALLIPPSIPMIIFSITSGISVGAAFLSTIVPGLLLALWYCVLNHFILRNEQGIQVHKPKSYKAQFQNIQQTGRKATFALLMPIIILGTIYSGLATPTEAASIAVVYSVVIGLMVYKGISFKQLMDITVSSVAMTGSIIAVLFFLFVMSRAMVFQQIPNQIADALLQISDNKLVLLLLINVLLMLIGMIVDDISGSILAAVIFLPIIKALGIDPIHFAAIVGVNLGLGNISPPCAPMLFMAGGVAKLSLDKYIKPTMKLILLGHLPMVLIVTFIPSLSLYLPSVLL
ncbi:MULTISPECIES: TRAP transporter large permease [Vibrio]|uniref:TRAP transporter large permease protein n=1 Tax=Vibrio fortis TaxID=212667 RepID=A0A5N3QVX5_9VIBR|nr:MULTISPECIES: TRAP transporter large permease [Vibrio]KAB0285395.1 TRAP transporter large permease [Vibrio fortis]MDK9735713.1 TRAP transporter large permease [Vibrio sp. D404a]MDK9762423.1 TRAP transporter large permease [Vibrio sp. D420a]MDK9798629.1 TRAP transporter large permease [Vibrio sp. D449a]QFT12816.1 Sialic acid TRAP transporter permease protein SiaT [Vibrio sp. THAF190c]